MMVIYFRQEDLWGQIAKILKKNKSLLFYRRWFKNYPFVDYPDKTESTLNNSFKSCIKTYVSGWKIKILY